ncbi:MAG: 23S rRNA (pseudouridine(1915)-N(3))-methyltransferase RlmH [Proteobacteria bacterium]|nr:23S rRNA (pseudouridine(1915)-N(3))-methyltransferase RlmH [Pseudomonadota bacterium]MBU1709264.1 23S rRNA (pseudouridine(1915)-N(3))-methyltransferase RlmH [Pseudomonadota bacterium]
MKIEFLFIGKTREIYLAQGIDDYCKRLQRYVNAEIKTIKTSIRSNSSPEVLKLEEGKALLARLEKQSYMIALDPGGKTLTSEDLARDITNLESQGRRSLSFIIGGELGLAQDVLAQADYVLSLSKMTFTHEMARMILLEQVYRAYTIKAGTNYHK